MDIVKALEELEKRKKGIFMAKEFAEKIEANLPKGWEAEYISSWDGLLFANWQKDTDSMSSFLLVCSLIEDSGMKLNKRPWMSQANDTLICLWADGYTEDRLRVEVRQFNIENCPLEFEEKTIMVAKVSEACLESMNVKDD